jgi:hypothetical protein
VHVNQVEVPARERSPDRFTMAPLCLGPCSFIEYSLRRWHSDQLPFRPRSLTGDHDGAVPAAYEFAIE